MVRFLTPPNQTSFGVVAKQDMAKHEVVGEYIGVYSKEWFNDEGESSLLSVLYKVQQNELMIEFYI